MSKTRAAWSGAIAALVALLLLFGSSLGQIAHFVAVQHAICAEHGDLVELHHDDHAGHGDEEPGQPQEGGDHDHCQQLARAERELATPAAPGFELALTSANELVAVLAMATAPAAGQELLALAPKTSPPRHAAG